MCSTWQEKSPAASVQGLGRSRARGFFLQPRCKYFAWLAQEKAAGGGWAFIRGRAGSRVSPAEGGKAATGSWSLGGALSKEKRRTGIPAAPTWVKVQSAS